VDRKRIVILVAVAAFVISILLITRDPVKAADSVQHAWHGLAGAVSMVADSLSTFAHRVTSG
jgi:hypothetical protein